MRDPLVTNKNRAKKIILNTLGYFPDRTYTRNALCAMVQLEVNRRIAFDCVDELLKAKKIILVGTETFGIAKKNERKKKE